MVDFALPGPKPFQFMFPHLSSSEGDHPRRMLLNPKH
jgi:hypothetical protein